MTFKEVNLFNIYKCNIYEKIKSRINVHQTTGCQESITGWYADVFNRLVVVP
jgi:hypothetical protein